jgi:nitrous oxidase accessory protein
LNKLLSILSLILLCMNLQAAQLEVGPGKTYKSIREAISSATAMDTLLIYEGIYREGTIEINKPLVINGINGPLLDGENEYEILQVRADSVVIRGLTLKDVGVSYVEDRSAIRLIGSRHCIIDSNQLNNAFFGIYLEHCQDCLILDNRVIGLAGNEMNSGNAIHLWYCRNIRILRNHAEGHRDGIYLEFVDNSSVENNTVVDNIRYGLHFMFSDHDRYLANRFESNGAGVAVMFSKYIRMEDNDFTDNWGSSAYGLLLKEITDSEIRYNRFRGNTTGIYGEGVSRTSILNNDFSRNGWALNILGSCADNTIRRNNFMNNTFDVSTNTSRNYNNYDGNFWSDNTAGYDLDRDGISDVPYRPVKLFSYMVGNIQSTTILMRSLLVELINHAEKVAPVITPHNLLDNEPLMRKIDHDRDQGIE